jgi:hypothetical protein
MAQGGLVWKEVKPFVGLLARGKDMRSAVLTLGGNAH